MGKVDQVVVQVKYGKKAGWWRARFVDLETGGFTYIGTFETIQQAKDSFKDFYVDCGKLRNKSKEKVIKIVEDHNGLNYEKVDLKSWNEFSKNQIHELSRKYA